jgi:transcriptional/translational regulatory protein YebC/TACO1
VTAHARRDDPDHPFARASRVRLVRELGTERGRELAAHRLPGAQDFERDGDGVRFYTEPTDLDAVSKALSALGWTVATMRLGWRAKNPVELADPAARAEVEQFLTELDEDDDVQHIYAALVG